MKVRFPSYVTSFSCVYTVQEVTKRILEAVTCQPNNLKVLEAYNSCVQRIILSARTDGCIYYNSFMPNTSIEIIELDDKTQVSFLFELKNSTKVFMMIFSAVAILFEISLIVLKLTNQLTILALLCFPIGMLILSYAFSSIGLFFYSMRVLRTLFMSITRENTKTVPSIHRCKHIG